MKSITLILLTLFITLSCISQDSIELKTQPIVNEGKQLYKSEMASWYGTDLFLEKFKDRQKIGGYFSYVEENIAKCIFFSKTDNPKVIGTISFDSSYNIQTAVVSMLERDFSEIEYTLFKIRSNALSTINSDTLFKTYPNTSLNLIPIVWNNEKKVYVLTGPQNSGVVIIGNDYLLNYDENNNLKTLKRLHKNIIPINYGKTENGKEAVTTMHSHLPETGDFITPTDICTIMLYEKFAKWEQHIVVSANYYSIWNCKTDQLFTMTMAAIKKINEHQTGKKKKKVEDD